MKKNYLQLTKYTLLTMFLLFSTVTLTGCTKTEENKKQTYQEIETKLTYNIVGNFNNKEEINNEITRLKEEGKVFWHDGSNIISHKTTMEKKPSEDMENFYTFKNDVYTVKAVDEENFLYSILKNEEELFTRKMICGSICVIEDASMVLDSPAFTIYDLEKLDEKNRPTVNRNIWYNQETMNEKFNVQTSSLLFAFKNKTGFVAERDNQNFIFFNGQKVSENFSELITAECCGTPKYPFTLHENGILFFIAKRSEKYFIIEINLNDYIVEEE